jgi:hypothetical protein
VIGVRETNGRGFDPFRKVYEEALQYSKPKESILVVNIGAWFNAKCKTGECDRACMFEGSDCVTSMLQGLQGGAEQHGHLDALARAAWMKHEIFKRVDACSGSNTTCMDHSCKYTGDQFGFPRVLAAFAEFIVRFRARLPDLIVLVDTPPQHYSMGAYCATDPHNDGAGGECDASAMTSPQASWKNEISHAIYDAMLPDDVPGILRVETFDTLLPRFRDHQKDNTDCTHYCMGSLGWKEHVGTILAAIAQRLATSNQHDECFDFDPDSRCTHLSLAGDRFVAGGLAFATAAVLSLALPAVLILRLILREACSSPVAAKRRKEKGGAPY